MTNLSDFDQDSTSNVDEIRRALQKILSSKLFRAAQGQRKFLQFVVEETLAGRESLIKEFTVGVEAFGRGESFDPRVDPIIRTEARKLRLRLAKYYDDEGKSDGIRIELPKGSYIPVFLSRESAPDLAVDSAHVDPEPEVELKPAMEAERPEPPLRTATAVVAALTLFTIVMIGLIWFVSARAASQGDLKSIAVLPFVNRTGDPAQNAIADRITESLIDRLSQESGMQVAKRDSVFRVQSPAENVEEIKKRLHVKTIVIGTMEKTGSTLRLRVRLTEKSGGPPLWSGSYTFHQDMQQSLEAEIAAEIVHVVRAGKSGEPSRRAAPQKRVAPQAWSAYREGLHYQAELGVLGLGRAVERFEKATQLDPSFARAWAELAYTWVLSAQVSAIPPAEVSGKIRQFATRAIQLDDSLGEPHFSLAVCAQYEYDWAVAEREFRKGLALNPSSAVGHLWYAKYLAITGRHPEVLVHRTIGAELDPLSPYAIQALAGYWSVKGEFPQAIAGFRTALALNPNFGLARQGLGIAYLLNGQTDEALAELQSAAIQQGGLRTRSLLGYAYGVAGKTKQAQEMLAEFLERERRGPFPALAIAHIYLGLGDRDRAFAWLEKAIDQRDLSATLQWDSLYASLRSDIRFVKLLKRMRLA